MMVRRSSCLRRAPDVRIALAFATLIVSGLVASRAEAYPWMIRHGHDGCVSCHIDPSGAGLLTAYGREQGDEELPMRYGRGDQEHATGPVWGLLDTPDWLLLGAGLRGAILTTNVSGGGAPAVGWSSPSFILMQADVRAGLRKGPLRASVSLGGLTNTSYASVVGNFVSREHWIGYAPFGDTFLVRAGRMNLPFGIRSIEHTLWVRQKTRTDINDLQEHGVAVAYNGSRVRAEFMGILGNYQISPDAYRQRGYSGTVELVPTSGLAVGLSSLVTYAATDVRLKLPNLRQAHGLFLRASPAEWLVLFAEGDVAHDAPTGAPTSSGIASLLQGDLEPLQGLHFILTGEAWSPVAPSGKSSFGGWAAVDWFCWRQVDVRLDFMWRTETMDVGMGPATFDEKAVLVQGHVYL